MDLKKAFELISEKLTEWMQELIKLLPNILLATLILVLGLFLAKKIRKLASRIFMKFSESKIINNLFSTVVYIFFVGIVLFTVLSILQLDKAVTSVLAGAGIIGLALAFAFQDIAANFISGIFITFRKPFRIGDLVMIDGYKGSILEINLRDTVIETPEGQMITIPNKHVFQNPIQNFSTKGQRRLDLVVGVSYGEDLEKVRTITLEAVKEIQYLKTDEETTMFFTEFGDSSINYVIRIWLVETGQSAYWEACSDAIIKIKKAYDNHSITIPFPIRTLDFGIKGGLPLGDVKIQNSTVIDNKQSLLK